MNLLKKIFGERETEFSPDNTKLTSLIQAYHQDNNNDNYVAVLEELYGNNAFLLVPTEDNSKNISNSKKWKTLEAGETLNFTSVFNLDGLLVLGVFTSEETLSKWTNEETTYTAIPSKTVLEISQEQNFGRIVIDSDQDTMFVLERNTSNIKTDEIKEETTVKVGTPLRPIEGAHKESLVNAFKKVSNISEVYHFAMQRNEEHLLILAIVLENQSENARKAVFGALNDGMNGFELDLPLDIMYLQPEDPWYATAKEFECFYNR